MMRRVDLLPESYLQRRRQRRSLGIVILAGLGAVLLLVGWWFTLNGQVGSANDDLAAAEARNTQLQTQIAGLQRFDRLASEAQSKSSALQGVMSGDIAWPTVLTEIAMVTPGEVWLTNLTASAGETEGATPVGTETAEVQINGKPASGRIEFQGSSLSMAGIAKWMIRLATVNRFDAIFLNSAQESESTTGPTTVDFDSTLELNGKADSDRFLGARP
jgi:Tfp pilus assembly protein PilN